MSNNKMQVVKDLKGKKIQLSREFNAPLENVWSAYTESDLLDQWWAPKPWKAETKKMDFRKGGHWLYCMVGPEGERHWARIDYKDISPLKSFDAEDFFCDENGNKNNEKPVMIWKNIFSATQSGTRVEIDIIFSSEADMQKIIEMGFEEGITIANDGLEELLTSK